MLLVWETIFWGLPRRWRVSFMHENHQDLNSIRIWLVKIYPVGGHSSWRKWTHEKLGEWWIAKDDWAIRVWWEIKSLKKKSYSLIVYIFEKDKRCMNLTHAVHIVRVQEIIKEWDLCLKWAFLVAHMVKNPPPMQETWVRSLGWEDALEKGMATHSSILAWRIPVDRLAWWPTVLGVTKSQTRLSD